MFHGIYIGVILALGGSGYLYYTTTQAELTELRDLNKVYELKHEQQAEALRILQEDFETQTAGLQELQQKSQQMQVEMNRYLDIFKRHNLTKLAAAKPGLIETRANKGTKNVFDSIEDISRSVDSLDDGVQPSNETSSGSQDSDKAGGEKNNPTSAP
jgi:uncharacterized protein (DUF3084 family)